MRHRSSFLLMFLAAAAFARTLDAQDKEVPGSWMIVPSPNAGPEAQGNQLYDVLALSPTYAWAVGARPNPTQYLFAPLAMRWNGTQWSLVDTPVINSARAQLTSLAAAKLSAGSNPAIWAVGWSDDPSCICGVTVIERFDGTAWRRVPSPNPGLGNYLEGVAAVSAVDAWAVGYQWISQSSWKPLLLHYDGGQWSNVDLPGYVSGRLSSVFARARDDVWAVGWIGLVPGIQGLALHWDGTSWTQVPFPTEQGGWIVLRSVSAVAADDVWAVGTFQFVNGNGQVENRARSFHWDGVAWSPVILGLAFESFMRDVHAVAADDVWGVGAGYIGTNLDYVYATMHWDGAAWSYVMNPNQGVLNAVSAASSAEAWAVGFGFITLGTHTLHYTAP